jgi:hypothetical protein
MLILLIGIVFFPPKDPVPRVQLIKTSLGMFISMIGIIMYSGFGMANAGCGAPKKDPIALQMSPTLEQPKGEAGLPPNLFSEEVGEDNDKRAL